ncbi:hypothetical protein [Amphibacillus jilinensis]|uniref:hypothetical protein n=1 Tax=Amphibacillus jilinensis TaxID=1216008 RepID=UPI001181A022|nr:hypothetical protein [Amphibacillus jilinensis]
MIIKNTMNGVVWQHARLSQSLYFLNVCVWCLLTYYDMHAQANKYFAEQNLAKNANIRIDEGND